MASKNHPAIEPEGGVYLRGQAAAARYLHVSPRCISEWQARKIISVIKVSRKVVLFRKPDLDAAMSRYEIPAIN